MLFGSVLKMFLISRESSPEVSEENFTVIAGEYFSHLHRCGDLGASQNLHVLWVKVGFDSRKIIGCVLSKFRKYNMCADKHTNQDKTAYPFQEYAHWSIICSQDGISGFLDREC